jgi:hypothetical protein
MFAWLQLNINYNTQYVYRNNVIGVFSEWIVLWFYVFLFGVNEMCCVLIDCSFV